MAACFDRSGFDDLLKYSEQYTKFYKDVLQIMTDRAMLEAKYQKDLAALAAKASKINPSTGGTFLNAWKGFCKQTESEAESHKALGDSIKLDAIKPMQKLMEAHAKSKKGIEAPVDKAAKSIIEKRNEAIKSQKNLLSKTKEYETTLTASEATKTAKGKELTQKERSKASTKHGKVNEGIMKADREYLKAVSTAEQARFNHMNVLNSTALSMQDLEQKYMEEYKNVLIKFSETLGTIIPKLRTHYEAIRNGFGAVNSGDDIKSSVLKEKTPNPVEQMLYDCFEDDMAIPLQKRNRHVHLNRKLEMLDDAIDKAERSKSEATRESANASSADRKKAVAATLGLIQANDFLNLLNASRYRIIIAMSTIDSKAKPTSESSQYIRSTKEKAGIVKSFLVLPRGVNGQAAVTVSKTIAPSPSFIAEPVKAAPVESAPAAAVAPAVVAPAVVAPVAIASNPAPPSSKALQSQESNNYHNDGWGDEDDHEDDENRTVIGVFKALYEFEASSDGEISLKAGDKVEVFEKGDDGWYYGRANGVSGNFPETYVEEMEEE